MGGMAYTVDLRSMQAPLKDRYRSDPTSALVVAAAQRYCSTLQTLRHGVEVKTEFALE
jgi:hypothetical protein